MATPPLDGSIYKKKPQTDDKINKNKKNCLEKCLMFIPNTKPSFCIENMSIHYFKSKAFDLFEHLYFIYVNKNSSSEYIYVDGIRFTK